jgi:negative regulator of sigma-B (phosphoserine phosphatase)
MEPMQITIAKRSFNGDAHCGDACSYWENGVHTVLCVADGLGHGVFAEIAAMAAIEFVSHHLNDPLPAIFESCNRTLRPTRGVAMGIATINEHTGDLTYAGIGNIRAMVVRGPSAGNKEGSTIRLASDSGIVGGGFRILRPETVAVTADDLVIMFTDGIDEQVDLSHFTVTRSSNLQKMAERIVRQWGRDSDDAAILIYRHEGNR